MSRRDPQCLFCKIVDGEIPAQVIHRNDNAVAFADIQPHAPVHWLVIPTAHTPCHAETEDPQVFADVFGLAREVARREGLSDYRLVVNNGSGAGQTVFHLHVHILAGRPLSWPPG